MAQVGAAGQATTEGATLGVELLRAAAEDDLIYVQQLLDCDADANEASPVDGATPLGIAARDGLLDIMRCLLDHGADPDMPMADPRNRHYPNRPESANVDEGHDDGDWENEMDGYTPLMAACEEGWFEAAHLLLEHNADLRNGCHPDCSGVVALNVVHDIDIAQLLALYGADLGPLWCDGSGEMLYPTAFASMYGRGGYEVAGWLEAVGASEDNCNESFWRVIIAISFAPAHARACRLLLLSVQKHPAIATQSLTWFAGRWSCRKPFRIAIASRLHTVARAALRSGAMADPTMCALADVTAAAAHPVLWETPPSWSDHRWPVPPTPRFCAATARLARDAMARWSPSLHWLHHHEFRAAVHTVLLVSQRLDLQHGNSHRCSGRPHLGGGAPADPGLPLLPPELWFCVCGWLLRRHWICFQPHKQTTRRTVCSFQPTSFGW